MFFNNKRYLILVYAYFQNLIRVQNVMFLHLTDEVLNSGFIIQKYRANKMENVLNKELYDKYMEYGFKKQMEKVALKFRELEQQVLYSDLQQSAKTMIIRLETKSEISQKLKNKRNINFYIVIGAKQSNHYEKFILNVIHSIPLPHQTYSIIYVNTLAGKNAFNDFMKVMELLPIEYSLHLDQIYVLQATFMNKAFNWVSFNIITNFIKGKTTHINDFEELARSTHLDQIQLLRLLPGEIQEELRKRQEHIEILLANKAMKLVTMEDMMMKQSKSQDREDHKEGNFSVSKSSIILCSPKKLIKHELQEYQIGQTGAPLALQMLIYYFNEREDLLKNEGIFRKSVSIDDQNQILEEIEQQNYDFIQSVTDPHVIANAIKRFLANLITPIVPYPIFEKLMKTDNTNTTSVTIQSIKALSEVKKKTIQIVFQFFQEKVVPKQQANKMSLNNVCIVIGPCIMRSEVASLKDILYSQKIIGIMSVIFKQFDSIFGNKKERNLALRKSANQFKKAYIEERLGMFESRMELDKRIPCELTLSQIQVIQDSRRPLKKGSKEERQKKAQKQSKNIQIWYQVSATIKQELEEQPEPESEPGSNEQIREDQEFFDISQTEKREQNKKDEVPLDEYTEIIHLEDVDEQLLKKYHNSI